VRRREEGESRQAERKSAGNQLAVIRGAASLANDEIWAVALEMNYSEGNPPRTLLGTTSPSESTSSSLRGWRRVVTG
jgi:hypothetical protein